MSDYPVIVIDPGTFSWKVGVAGERGPRGIFAGPNYFKNPSLPVHSSTRQHIYTRRVIENIDETHVDFCDRLDAIARGYLNCSLAKRRLLIVDPELACHGFERQEKLLELVFERIQPKSVMIIPSTQLACYATGRLTGLVLESGDTYSRTAVISEGRPMLGTIHQYEFGGRDITDQIARLLEKNNLRINDVHMQRELKETRCIAEPAAGCRPVGRVRGKYVLPDGTEIRLAEELSGCLAPLFQATPLPRLLTRQSSKTYKSYSAALSGKQNDSFDSNEDLRKTNAPGKLWKSRMAGFSSSIFWSLDQVENLAEQRTLFSNIILTGGNTMFQGVKERLVSELTELRLKFGTFPVPKVIALPRRDRLPWVGGSMVGQLSEFDQQSLTHMCFLDQGPEAIREYLLQQKFSVNQAETRVQELLSY